MSCHWGEMTDIIQPSVASGILPCMARSAATMVFVWGNSDTGFGQVFPEGRDHNADNVDPGNGFCLESISVKIVFAISAFATGCSTRTPSGTCPGQEIISGT